MMLLKDIIYYNNPHLSVAKEDFIALLQIYYAAPLPRLATFCSIVHRDQ